MPDNNTYTQEQGFVLHRTHRLFGMVLGLGLDVEMSDDGESGVFRLAHSRIRTVEEEEACRQFLKTCERRIHDKARARLELLMKKLAAHQINAGEFLAAAENNDKWMMQSTIAECRCRDDDRPPMPTGKTTTPDEREAFENVEFHADPYGSATLGAGVYFKLHHDFVPHVEILDAAEAIEIWASLAVLMHHVGEAIANADPPDLNFDTVPEVHRPGRIQLDMGSSSSAIQQAFGEALDLHAEQLSVSVALLTAIERSQGAELAGQGVARDRQLAAAADFAGTLAPILEALAGARTALVAAFRAAGATIVIDADELLPAFLDGPSAEFIRGIDHYGVRDLTPGELWQRAGAHLFDGDNLGDGVFPELLNPPELALAEIKAAQACRSIAGRWG
jgi:hypothetical protein